MDRIVLAYSGGLDPSIAIAWLAETFKDFASKDIDFDIIAAYKPVYDPEPRVDDEGKLLVKGWFPTEPARVVYDLKFIPSDGEWKLIGINVKTERAPNK